MTDLAIETHHLRKEYGPKVAVQDLTLQIPRGEVFGFLGPNGAGKSTTVKMLLALAQPTHGEIKLFGQYPGRPQARAKVGFLPEHFRFHEWLRAGEFLMFHGKLYGLPVAVLKERIPPLLELVGLADSAHMRLSKFSKGMLQRIGLAQAMLNRPDLIFLDEPTSGLDPLGRRLVRRIIHQLKDAGTTIFLNSHFLSEVEVTCDRVAFIKAGRVVRLDTMANLLRRTTEVKLRVDAFKPELLAALEQVGHRAQQDGSSLTMLIEDQEMVPLMARLVFEHGAKLYQLSPREKSLEEIFISIIGPDNAGGSDAGGIDAGGTNERSAP
ncbi:MAG: ABC transporter ATP-binding protein [Anaerolineae bacterium]|nr:ABC transporter ATP-binding protein [Anaerolineae bacterium]